MHIYIQLLVCVCMCVYFLYVYVKWIVNKFLYIYITPFDKTASYHDILQMITTKYKK